METWIQNKTCWCASISLMCLLTACNMTSLTTNQYKFLKVDDCQIIEVQDTFYLESLISAFITPEFRDQYRCMVRKMPLSYEQYFEGIYLVEIDSVEKSKCEYIAQIENDSVLNNFLTNTYNSINYILNVGSSEVFPGYYYYPYVLDIKVQLMGYTYRQIPCFNNCNFGNGHFFHAYVPLYRIVKINSYNSL